MLVEGIVKNQFIYGLNVITTSLAAWGGLLTPYISAQPQSFLLSLLFIFRNVLPLKPHLEPPQTTVPTPTHTTLKPRNAHPSPTHLKSHDPINNTYGELKSGRVDSCVLALLQGAVFGPLFGREGILFSVSQITFCGTSRGLFQ